MTSPYPQTAYTPVDVLDGLADATASIQTQDRLTQFLEDRRTRATLDWIHQNGSPAIRAALEDLLAETKRRVRNKDITPCPF